MILPIYAYGSPVLREVGKPISADYQGLNELISNMFETMYNANGVGLAAPQIGRSIRLFVIDAKGFADDEDLSEEERIFLSTFKKVFINAKILEQSGKEWAFNEGCLSIPGVNEDVRRLDTIVVQYQDEKFQEHTETFTGLAARIIQHEYDHIEGILFTDSLSSFKKRILKGKLANISKGKVGAKYRMNFPEDKRR